MMKSTGGQSCRTCGALLIALALTIVLPPVLINILMGGKVLKRVVKMLTGKVDSIALDILGPMLVTFLLPAIIAVIVGVVLLLGKHDRRRCGKILLGFVGFSIFMLTWSFIPIPWMAMGINNAYVSRLRSFAITSLLGLYAMEGWAVFLHVPVIVGFWCWLLFVGWNTIAGARAEQ